MLSADCDRTLGDVEAGPLSDFTGCVQTDPNTHKKEDLILPGYTATGSIQENTFRRKGWMESEINCMVSQV